LVGDLLNAISPVVDNLLGDGAVKGFLKYLSPDTSSHTAFGISLNTDEVAMVLNVPLDNLINSIPPFNALTAVNNGVFNMLCKFKYSSSFNCKVNFQEPKWFQIALEGAVWVAREIDEEAGKTVRVIAAVAKDAAQFTDKEIQKTANDIVSGTLSVGSDVASWAKSGISWCGTQTVTDGAKCGFDTVTDASVCGVSLAANAAVCGYDTITDAAKCGTKTITDAAKCGTEKVEDGAQCGYDTVTDGAKCGYDTVKNCVKCVGVIFGGHCDCGKSAKSCKVPKSCDVAKSCKIADTCNFPKTCNVPNSCKVPKTCKSINQC